MDATISEPNYINLVIGIQEIYHIKDEKKRIRTHMKIVHMDFIGKTIKIRSFNALQFSRHF